MAAEKKVEDVDIDNLAEYDSEEEAPAEAPEAKVGEKSKYVLQHCINSAANAYM